MDDDKQTPIEVRLVEKVKSCTDCSWFWGAIPPYGPYPAFDWDETYPKSIKDGPIASEESPIRWTEVREDSNKTVEPAVMRGCRKAPIMTVGINPNMTAFFAGAQATTWAYPHFSKEATYAYYYRHATLYQESFSLDELEKQIIPGSEIRSDYDCDIIIDRSDTHRWLSLIFVRGEEVVDRQEHAWLPDERLVIFAPRKRKFVEMVTTANSDCSDDSNKACPEKLVTPVESLGSQRNEIIAAAPKYQIKKGDLIAAKIKPMIGDKKTMYANRVGYYARITPVLENLNQYFKSAGFNNCDLTVGEDVCMHDMVGCASPGWTSRYNIPTDWVSHNCVTKKKYMLDQLIQTQPRVVIIVSTSSLQMFAKGLEAISGSMDKLDNTDNFALLQETASNRRMIYWQHNGHQYESRLMIVPHFSYGDNFKQQCRIPSVIWQGYKQAFTRDVEILNDQGIRIDEVGWDGKPAEYVAVYIDEDDTRIESLVGKAFWQAFMAFHLNPFKLMETALINEHEHSPLITNASAEHLDRPPGNCQFCVNEKWQFPEGCEYGVAKPVS